MAIQSSDVKFYKALANNDTNANGGKISSTLVVSNSVGNVFPNVTATERTSGLTRFRKLFIKPTNADDSVLYNCDLFMGSLSSGEDYHLMKSGTDTDVQSDASGYTNWWGTGSLQSAISSGESSLLVNFQGATGIFSGEDVWARLIDFNDTNIWEDVKVVGSPSWAGDTATVTISGELQNAYSSSSKFCSFVDMGDLETTITGWTETSASGTYDESNFPVTLYNNGTVSDDWTLTFTTASSFSVSGLSVGSVGTGNINSDFSPVNASGGYYFTIDKDGWAGSWAAGETITFTTRHAARPVWIKEIVPAGANSHSNNVLSLNWKGETA